MFTSKHIVKPSQSKIQSTPKTLVVVTWNGKENSRINDSFIEDQPRQFDLLIFDYSGSKKNYMNSKDIYFLSKKTECKGQIYLEVDRFLNINPIEYSYIGLIDDDILIKYSDINYMMKVANIYQLDSFSASLSHDSYHSHPHTLRVPNTLLHWVSWVEVMMPFYRKAIFEKCALFYPHSISSWGLDCYAMPLIQKILEMERVAIIDAVMAVHYRPVRSQSFIFSNGLTPMDECQIIKDKCIKTIQRDYPLLLNSEWFRHTFGSFQTNFSSNNSLIENTNQDHTSNNSTDAATCHL